MANGRFGVGERSRQSAPKRCCGRCSSGRYGDKATVTTMPVAGKFPRNRSQPKSKRGTRDSNPPQPYSRNDPSPTFIWPLERFYRVSKPSPTSAIKWRKPGRAGNAGGVCLRGGSWQAVDRLLERSCARRSREPGSGENRGCPRWKRGRNPFYDVVIVPRTLP